MLRKIWGFLVEARRSPFNTMGEKLEVFRILLSLSIKSFLTKNRKVKKKARQTMFGFEVVAYDYYALKFLFEEIFLGWEYHFDYQGDTPKIIDCGANIGMTTLFLKRLYPNATILAFEPNPYAFELLKENVENNNLQGVILKNVGLSAENGELDFYLGEDKGSVVGSLIPQRGGANVIKVKTEQLSTYMLNKQYDLVKMDVEGAEWGIFKDLHDNNVIRCSDRYIMEYHHKIEGEPSRLSEFLTYFEEIGFGYNLRSSFEQVGGFQDILINAYQERQHKDKVLESVEEMEKQV